MLFSHVHIDFSKVFLLFRCTFARLLVLNHLGAHFAARVVGALQWRRCRHWRYAHCDIRRHFCRRRRLRQLVRVRRMSAVVMTRKLLFGIETSIGAATAVLAEILKK